RTGGPDPARERSAPARRPDRGHRPGAPTRSRHPQRHALRAGSGPAHPAAGLTGRSQGSGAAVPAVCEHVFVSDGDATILHADLDAFYASVEQRDDPRLRGRPVIVGVGVVLAASYEARAYGVRTAMRGARARRMCPRAIVVEPRMSAYADASKAVFEVFE